MESKKCRECGEIKPLSEYYKHSQMFDGYLNKCKACKKKASIKYREDNLDKVRDYDRNRPNKEARNEANKIRAKAISLEIKNKYSREWRQRNKDKQSAHNKVARSKELSAPECCSECGIIGKIEAHHPDYNKPLEVVWLCRKCHNNEHKRLREEERKMEIPF